MSTKNVKITILYDGTCYSGWQIQKDQDTIQGKLKECIESIVQESNVNIIGSGRTDSGVHALGQVANFKVDSDMSDLDFKNAINAKAPKDIRIIKVEIVDNNFNSRFSALKREYINKIKKTVSPFDYKYYWDYKYDFNKFEPNKGWTGALGVLRNFRRRGIATALKIKAIEKLLKKGVTELRTDNEKNNPMYKINVALGFKPVPFSLDYSKKI